MLCGLNGYVTRCAYRRAQPVVGVLRIEILVPSDSAAGFPGNFARPIDQVFRIFRRSHTYGLAVKSLAELWPSSF
jgi:hypothetical protein